MRRQVLMVIAVAAAGLLAAPALAQQAHFGGTPPLMLLSQKSVQDELKLTDDQVKQVSEAASKQREEFQQLSGLGRQERVKKMEELRKKSEKTVAGILKPEQAKRLQQIALQRQGAWALTNPAIAKELQLTDEQKKKIHGISDETGKQFRELRQAGAGNREEARKKFAELNKSAGAKIMNLLTDDQKARWKEMLGKPFKGELHFGPPGGRPARAPARK